MKPENTPIFSTRLWRHMGE